VQQRGQESAIGGREADFVGRELPLQHADLVARQQDFRVLIVVTDRRQAMQRERVRDTQVGQPRQHG
jgi:hypothetical protein